MIKAIAATKKPYVVVLMNGRPLTIEWLAANAPAILITWRAGTMGGPAVADVLFGDVNPSGKLPMTFPRSVGQIPIHYDYKQPGKPQKVKNARVPFTSRYIDSPNEPLYTFGFGLSYTTFLFKNLRANATSMKALDYLKVSVDVMNTGKRDGAEVVQLFIQDVAASVARPVRQLKGFKKIRLAVGEKKQVDFVIGKKHLRFLDAQWHPTVEAGRFVIYIGNSSDATMSLNFTVSNTYIGY